MKQEFRISKWGMTGYIAIFFLNAFFWWRFRSYLNVLFGVAMIAACVVSFLLLRANKELLTAKVMLPSEKVGRHSTFVFHVKIYNQNRWLSLPVLFRLKMENVFVESYEEKEECVRAYPGENKVFSSGLATLYCGMLEIQIEQFLIFDPLHLFYVESQKKESGHAVAGPVSEEKEVEKICELVEDFPQEDKKSRTGVDYTADYEIREYEQGDELRNIHWKLSAKQDELITKERLSSGSRKINVILDFEEDKTVNDGLMDSLQCIGESLIKEEYPMQLYWWSAVEKQMKSRLVSEIGELEQIMYEILSMSSMGQKLSVKQYFETEYPQEAYVLVRTGAVRGMYVAG